MNGLHAALDELVTEVPEYGDLDRAIVQADHERRRRHGLLAGLAAAAAVVAVVAGGLAITRGDDAAPPPVAPTPTPTPTPPSEKLEAPGAQDHATWLVGVEGSLVMATLPREDRVGSATLWRRDPGGWRRLGTLERVVPLHWRADSDGTRLSAGPGARDVVATGLADETVGFSRDGGATWSYLAAPAGCARACFVGGNAHFLSAFPDGVTALWLAAFGSSSWDEVTLPATSDPQTWRWTPIVLDDGTLVISEQDADLTGRDEPCSGRYRISRDRGATWSDSREMPGSSTCIEGSSGSTIYAWDDAYSGDDRSGHYRSTDLVHWTPVRQGNDDWHLPGSPSVCSGWQPGQPRSIEPPVRVGQEFFSLSHLNYRNGEEIRPRRGLLQEGPHEVNHVLMVSQDDCHTWQRVLR